MLAFQATPSSTNPDRLSAMSNYADRELEESQDSAGAQRRPGVLGATRGPGEARTRSAEARRPAGARRGRGVWGATRGPRDARSRSATAPPGRDERLGCWGPHGPA